MDKPIEIPAAAHSRAAALQLRAPRRHDRGSVALAARPGLSRGRRPGRARLSEGRECLFRGGDGAAPGADRRAVRGDEGARSRRTTLGPASATATVSIGGRSSPARNIAPGTASPSAAATDQIIFDEPAEAEGKEYFRLGALEVSPDGSCSRRWSTTTAPSASSCASAISRPARTSRRSPRSASASRSGPRTATRSSSPRSTTIGAATAPAAPARRGRRRRRTLYEETEESASASASAARRTSSWIFIATGDNQTERSALRRRRRSRRAAVLISPAPGQAPISRRCARTANCGS